MNLWKAVKWYALKRAQLRMKLEPIHVLKRAREAEATVKVTSLAFPGYPYEDDYEDLAAAVEHLREIWDLLDDWPGDTNIRRWEEWKKSQP